MNTNDAELLNRTNFSKSSDGLIPVIIQDSETDKVLMLGYMNEEALRETIESRKVTFYSRSKKRLWVKGETSRNFLSVEAIMEDCDNDTILIKVQPSGPVCHTGADTCFNEKNTTGNDFLYQLEKIIADRKLHPNESSYTSSLFVSGINKIAQKVGEEAIELIIESKDDNKELFKNEAADLLFHYLVLLREKEHSIRDIIDVLHKRHK